MESRRRAMKEECSHVEALEQRLQQLQETSRRTVMWGER